MANSPQVQSLIDRNLVTQGDVDLVAAGAGNIVAAGAGNIVAKLIAAGKLTQAQADSVIAQPSKS